MRDITNSGFSAKHIWIALQRGVNLTEDKNLHIELILHV